MTSCSWLSNRKTLFGDDAQESKASDNTVQAVPTTVPKAQYDQLLKKYEMLVKTQQATSTVTPRQKPFAGKDPSDIVSALNNAKARPELVETVDVFGEKGIAKNSLSNPAQLPIVAGAKVSDSEVEGQIVKLKKASILIDQNKLDAALTLLKELENSPVRQIRVRSKFYLGELLFIQGEYDLAMQVYEEIVQKDAFSGIVIKTLGRLIVCSEKLKLKKKQQKYYSILHDFFESV
jgi:TolA-binding protein